MNPWIEEPALVPESNFQNDGFGSDYHAWNNMAPELEFCERVAEEASKVHPNGLIVETGLGQGFVTRRVLEVLEERPQYVVFDTDERWHDYLLKGFKGRKWPWPNLPYFTVGKLGGFYCMQADLVILDSDTSVRQDEFLSWEQHGKSGSVCIIHDTYHRTQPPGEITSWVRRLKHWTVEWLDNPRGGAIVIHP